MALKTRQAKALEKSKASPESKQAKAPESKAAKQPKTNARMVKVKLLHGRVVQLPPGSSRRYGRQKVGDIVQVSEDEAQRLIAKNRARRA